MASNIIYAVDIRPAVGQNLSCNIRLALPVCVHKMHCFSTFQLIIVQPRCFEVGDAFSFYEDLKKHVEEFERANFIHL